VIVEDDPLDSENLVRLGDLGFSPYGERSAGFSPVTDVAVRRRNEEYMMSQLRPACSAAADLEFAIIGVSAERNDAQFAVVCGHLDARDFSADH
jgi:hypothetical protein